jgi:hypothetical protein
VADAFAVEVVEAGEDLFEDVFLAFFVQNCVGRGNLIQQFHASKQGQDLVYFVFEVVSE